MFRGKMFRGQGKFLRPNQDDVEEDSSDEDEDEEEEQAPAPRKANMNLEDDDDVDDDDDDEEEDDEEEEEEEEDKKRRASTNTGGPKKKQKTSSFFDEEAQDDEDEDEEDDEPYGTHKDPDDIVKKHYTEEDIRREQMDEDTRELIRLQDRRRAQTNKFGEEDEDEQSVAAMARAIEDRHRMERRTVNRSFLDRGPAAGVPTRIEDDGPVSAAYTAVSQQSLVPSVSDPSLWMVSCTTGQEEQLVYQIMNKSIAFARQGRPLGITGVVAAQTKGRIYIESYSEPAVLEAIQGVRGLMTYSMRLIPIGDMTTVMTVKPTKVPGKCFEVSFAYPHYT
jgi:transcription elongation factor SPT5